MYRGYCWVERLFLLVKEELFSEMVLNGEMMSVAAMGSQGTHVSFQDLPSTSPSGKPLD